MSWLSDFFGGPSGPKARDQWTEKQRHLLLYPMVEGTGQDYAFSQEMGMNPYAYAGPYAPQASPLQQQAFGMAPQVAQGQMAGLSRIAGGQAPLESIYNYGTRYANDVLTPQVMERFAGAGTSDSGGAARGLGRELGNYGLGMQSQMAPLALQNQSQQLQALQGMGSIPQSMAGMGGQQYNVASNLTDARRQRYLDIYDPYRGSQYSAGLNLLGLTNQAAVQGSPGGMGYNMVQSAFGDVLGAGTDWLTGKIF